MTPNEFYALTPVAVRPWHEVHSVVSRVLEFHDWDGYDDYSDPDAVERFTVEEKLDLNIDHRRSVTLYALYLDGRPFALMFTAGREGRDERDMFVTDGDIWKAARDYAISAVNKRISPSKGITDVTAELTNKYYGCAIARFEDGTRFVGRRDVSPFSGSPVYNRRKFEQAFETGVKPLAAALGSEGGLGNPRMLEAASGAIRAGILGSKVDFELDLGGGARIVGGTVLEGQAYVFVVDTGTSNFEWVKKMNPHMVGPASILECFTGVAKGRIPGEFCDYVREASEVFDCDPAIVHSELVDFVHNGGKSMDQRILEAIPRDPRIDPQLWDSYADFAIGFITQDNPDVRRFCKDGGIDDQDARRRVEMAAEIVARRNGETSTPTPAP